MTRRFRAYLKIRMLVDGLEPWQCRMVLCPVELALALGCNDKKNWRTALYSAWMQLAGPNWGPKPDETDETTQFKCDLNSAWMQLAGLNWESKLDETTRFECDWMCYNADGVKITDPAIWVGSLDGWYEPIAEPSTGFLDDFDGWWAKTLAKHNRVHNS